MNKDMATRHQLRRIHIVVELNLWEISHPGRLHTKRNIACAVTTGGFDAWPVLDLGQNQRHQLVDKVVGRSTAQGGLGTSL